MARRERRYQVIANRTDKIIVLRHPTGAVADVVLAVRGAAVIDPDVWDPVDVPQLRSLIETGAVELYDRDSRPEIRNPLDGVKWPDNPIDAAIAKEIVLTNNETLAQEHIMMSPQNERVAGAPLDIAFLRQRQRPILVAALQALERMDDPRVAARIELIKQRIEEIDKMPAA